MCGREGGGGRGFYILGMEEERKSWCAFGFGFEGEGGEGLWRGSLE